MDKKLTTTLGIALGASLLAGAGFGIYKYFSKKSNKKAGNASANAGTAARKAFVESFIGNGLIKSNSLYGGVENGLVGGGLYKEQAA
ncbi:hypothetical protein [Spirosoma sp.]|uniref:hypothetical protein n=1 Tax=Spirosoma sp. TaxID=1899569 RepID=UPI003B3B50E8